MGSKKGLKAMVVVAVLIGLNTLAISERVTAEEGANAKCSLTIYSNKNDWNNKALASAPCTGHIEGWYDPFGDAFMVWGGYSGEVTNGQQVEIGFLSIIRRDTRTVPNSLPLTKQKLQHKGSRIECQTQNKNKKARSEIIPILVCI